MLNVGIIGKTLESRKVKEILRELRPYERYKIYDSFKDASVERENVDVWVLDTEIAEVKFLCSFFGKEEGIFIITSKNYGNIQRQKWTTGTHLFLTKPIFAENLMGAIEIIEEKEISSQ